MKKTPTKHDRSEPPCGEPPLLELPRFGGGDLSNGIKLYGIENDELPMIQFTMRIDGGQALDPEGKEGVALFAGIHVKRRNKS